MHNNVNVNQNIASSDHDIHDSNNTLPFGSQTVLIVKISGLYHSGNALYSDKDNLKLCQNAQNINVQAQFRYAQK